MSSVADSQSFDSDSEPSLSELAFRLIDWFNVEFLPLAAADSTPAGTADHPAIVIALSGGVDSAVVAKAAALSQIPALAVTSDSPSVARREIQDARTAAQVAAIEQVVLQTRELEDADYVRNDVRRCYYCKSNLFAEIRQRYPDAVIVTGTNADDLGDYRPGLTAASEAAVRAPLAELGIDKSQVRQLARLWSLPISDKPASPCLASRLAYGVEVTPQRLAMVERAEAYVRSLGVRDCRVRLHADDLARIEVPLSDIALLATVTTSEALAREFRSIGFRCVTLDLEGLRSGSLNALVQIGR